MARTLTAFRLDADALAELDRVAVARGTDRSTLLRAAVDSVIGREPETPSESAA